MGADAGEVDGTSLNELVEDAIKAYTPETMWSGKRIFKRGGEFDWNHVFDFCDALKTENAKTTSWSNSIWTEYNTTALNRNNYKLGVDTKGNVTVLTDWKDCAANGNDKHTSGRGCLDNFITIMNGLCQQANAFDLASSSAAFPRFEIGKGTDVGMFDKGLALKEMNAWASYIEKDPDGPHRQKTVDTTVTLKGNAQKPEFIVAFQGTKSTDHSMWHYNMMMDPIYTCLGSSCNIIRSGFFHYMNGLKGCLDDFVDNHKVLANSATYNANTFVHAHTTFITGHSLGGAVVCLWGLFGKVTCYDLYSIDRSIFNSFETTNSCVNDWAATSEIYIEMSIADNWITMGAIFSMTIHSGYGFYPLCITGASTDRIDYDNGEAPKSYWGSSGSAISNSYENTEVSCTQA